jgi:hypothetical protein
MEPQISTPSLFINALCTGAFILFGELIDASNNIHLPPIVIETMQILSYASGISVAVLTFYNFISKKRKK